MWTLLIQYFPFRLDSFSFCIFLMFFSPLSSCSQSPWRFLAEQSSQSRSIFYLCYIRTASDKCPDHCLLHHQPSLTHSCAQRPLYHPVPLWGPLLHQWVISCLLMFIKILEFVDLPFPSIPFSWHTPFCFFSFSIFGCVSHGGLSSYGLDRSVLGQVRFCMIYMPVWLLDFLSNELKKPVRERMYSSNVHFSTLAYTLPFNFILFF